MSDEEFEGMVIDFQKVVAGSKLTYAELGQQEKSLMMDEAYLDKRHFQHKERRSQVEAIRREQAKHEEAREKHRRAKEAREGDFSNDLHIEGGAVGSAYRRRNLLRLYGPKAGGDTPEYRASLTPALRKLVEAELGPPRDRVKSPFGRIGRRK